MNSPSLLREAPSGSGMTVATAALTFISPLLELGATVPDRGPSLVIEIGNDCGLRQEWVRDQCGFFLQRSWAISHSV